MHRMSVSGFHEVKLNTGIYRNLSQDPFPLSLQCFLLRDAPPVGPRFSLWINMIHGAVPSLSLINNETNSKEKTQRYNLQRGYLSHYYYEGENIFWTSWRLFWGLKYVMRPNPNQHEEGLILTIGCNLYFFCQSHIFVEWCHTVARGIIWSFNAWYLSFHR